MKQLVRIIRFIFNHPAVKGGRWAALNRFIKWQIGYRINSYPVVYPFIENSKLLVDKNMTGATGNIYVGLHEFNDMAFLLHFLRPEDLFVDIGANVGSYTVLASAVIKADSFAVEPVPSTFENLRNNIYINRLEDRVRAFNVGLGASKRILKFTSNLDTVNHALISDEYTENALQVPIEKLDDILENKTPSLLKIDVEGFEQEVLAGASATLQKHELKAIIIELNGSGSHYGFDEKQIHKMLLSVGFEPYQYEPFTRSLNPVKDFGTHNTIYIRDFEMVNSRVKKARKIRVLNQTI